MIGERRRTIMDDLLNGGQRLFEITDYLTTKDRAKLKEAYDFSRQEHGTQRRKSGELFFNHPVEVASYLAGYRMDSAALEAALLHDIAEDTRISIEQIETQFGSEVGGLVNAVTKLKEVTRGVRAEGRVLTPEELQNATLRKLFRAMTQDVRTVIIKLFDRLHNMRTIKAMPPHKQVEKAKETLAVFAPLANRLGMWEVKSELEALSLEVLHPDDYHTLMAELQAMQEEQQALFEVVRDQAMAALTEAGINVRSIRLAPENVYTVYRDLITSGKSYRDMDRVMRIVILVDDDIACYTALGNVHKLWQAVPDRFDDYISVRRDNLYQSLHTTVVHDSGQTIKIRLRTEAMDKVAQVGVLARWLYAGTPQWSRDIASPLNLFFDNINDNINADPYNVTESVRGVVEDALGEQIYVYTPQAELRELPRGATAIDFAYAIHTALGNETQEAYVNDVPFPLNRPLRSGDSVRIIRNSRSGPERAWLDEDLGYIATNTARSRARQWFRKLPEQVAVTEGRHMLDAELELLGLPGYPHEQIVKSFNRDSPWDLYHALGRAELLPTVVATRIMSDTWSQGTSKRIDNVVYTDDGSKYVITNAGSRELRLCSTCAPRPRDRIVGYVRKDGGVTVHREGCHTLSAQRIQMLGPRRKLKLNWGEGEEREARLFTVYVDVFDRPGLLYEITQLMNGEGINIPQICTRRGARHDELGIELELELTSPRQLVRVLHRMQALVNVKTVRCDPRDADPPSMPLGTGLYLPE